MNFSKISDTITPEQAVEVGVQILARHLNTSDDVQYEKVNEEDFQKFLVIAIKALSLRIPSDKLIVDEPSGELVCPTCGNFHFNRTIDVCLECGQVLRQTRHTYEASAVDYREFRSKLELLPIKEGFTI